MKLQSTKSDTQNKTDRLDESTLAQPPASDLVFNMIAASLIPNASTQTTTTEEDSNSSQQEEEVSTSSMEQTSSPEETDPFLNQFNLMGQFQPNDVINSENNAQSDIDLDAVLANTNKPIKNTKVMPDLPNITQMTNKTTETLQTTELKPTIVFQEAELLTQQLPVEQAEANANALTNSDLFSETDDDSENGKMTQKNMQSAAPKQEIQPILQNAVPQSGSLIDTQPGFKLNSADLLTNTHQKIEQNNQYAEVFSRIGELINTHTMKEFPANEALNMNASTATIDYAEILKKSASSSYELKIDLLPPSIDALMKDTFHANIKIYPPELGNVLARLKVDKNNAELVITAENNRVKEIIQSNLGALREHFKEANLNLASIQVDTINKEVKNQQGNQESNQHGDFMKKESTNVSDMSKESTSSPAKRQSVDSIIDTYA